LSKLEKEEKEKSLAKVRPLGVRLRLVFCLVFDNFHIFDIIALCSLKPMVQFCELMMILCFAIDECLSFLIVVDEK